MLKNLKGIDLALLKVLNDLNTLKVSLGHVAEWLRRGLQILLFQFDSGRGLHQIISLITKHLSILTRN